MAGKIVEWWCEVPIAQNWPYCRGKIGDDEGSSSLKKFNTHFTTAGDNAIDTVFPFIGFII